MFIPARWRYLWLFFVVLVCALVFRLAFVDRLNELKQPYEIHQGALIDQAALLINTRLSLVETQIRLFRHELELLKPTQAELERPPESHNGKRMDVAKQTMATSATVLGSGDAARAPGAGGSSCTAAA